MERGAEGERKRKKTLTSLALAHLFPSVFFFLVSPSFRFFMFFMFFIMFFFFFFMFFITFFMFLMPRALPT